MKPLRLTVAALLFGGVLAPLGPHALAHALEFAHSHRHADGTGHSHDHDADHHENDGGFVSERQAGLVPSRTTMRSGPASFSALRSAAPALYAPEDRASSETPGRSGAPPGRRPSPHLGRAPPA